MANNPLITLPVHCGDHLTTTCGHSSTVPRMPGPTLLRAVVVALRHPPEGQATPSSSAVAALGPEPVR